MAKKRAPWPVLVILIGSLLAAGGVTNMFTIAESLLGARSVVRL